MTYLYHLLVYNPLYNGLIFLMDKLPWIDAGLAVVVFTILVKLILFPLSKKAVSTQLKMKKIEPELAALKEQYKNDKQTYAVKTMELYKQNEINPFASIILLFIQLPIIIALYRIFIYGFKTVNTTILYHSVAVPAHISTHFLGLIDITGKSLWLALAAGITSYIQIRYSMPLQPKVPPKENMTKEEQFRHDLSRTMGMQMRFMLPVLAFFVSWTISAAIAIYWITSNLFTIGQELVIRRTLKKTQ